MKKLLTLFALIPTLMFGQTPTIQQVTNAGNTSTKIIKYNANHGLQFDARTLTDKGYVDSVAAILTSLATPTLTNTYVGFGSASNLLSGSSNFTWNNSTKVLDILTGKYHGKQMILDDASGGFSYLGLNNIGTPTAAPSSGVFLFGDAAGNFNVETIGGKSCIFNMTGLTGNRTCTLQDGSGTLAFLSNIPASLPTSSTLSTVLTNGNTTGANSIDVSLSSPYGIGQINGVKQIRQFFSGGDEWLAEAYNTSTLFGGQVDIYSGLTGGGAYLNAFNNNTLTNNFLEVTDLKTNVASDNSSFQGVVETYDYSPNYVAGSLIRKGYADARYASISTTTATPTGSAGGDLTGTYPNPTIKSAVALLGAATVTATPTAGDNSSNIANTAFVKTAIDNAVAGLGVKLDVAYASTSALPVNTYSNGSAGVGATLTGTSNGPLIVDGVTILVGQVGERVLVAGESTSANNGWYTITQQGVIAVSPYILTRATESDQAAEIGAGYLTGVVAPNAFTPGSSNNGKLFISVAAAPFTVGTTALTFSQVGSTYSAGTGLTLSGTTFSLTNTAVSASNYGSATTSPTYTVNAQGQITNAASVTVTPAATSITGLGAGISTWWATPSSANLAAAITDETGSGLAVFGTSPSLTTPTLGVATATSVNKITIVAPASSGTIAITDGKSFNASNTLTLAGTDGTTMTFPSTSATIARTDAANTFTGVQTMTNAALTTPTISSSGFTNAQHAHTGATSGGQLTTAALSDYVAPTDYSATSTIVGWSSFTIKVIQYSKVGKVVTIAYNLSGTSNATSASFTIPFTSINVTAGAQYAIIPLAEDNGVFFNNSFGGFVANSNIMTMAKDFNATPWTASGAKQVAGTITIQVQ